MANMVIRALKAFTLRDADTGELTSIAHETFATVTDTVGAALIEDGLAADATKEITSNGTVDVTGFEKVTVAVE